MGTLRDRIDGGPPILLDGALGTELERRGIRSDLPLWSAHALLEAPDAVRHIHGEYAAAGAEILTAGTFRTQRRTLARAGLAHRAEELTRTAVRLAREGAALAREGAAVANEAEASRAVRVAGSASPLEDCYRPDLAPDPETALREHREHARNLARAEVDLILVETMNSVAEARAAARAAAETGLPFFVSFVAEGSSAPEDARLLSGEPLARALEAVSVHGPAVLLVNCLPTGSVPPCLAILRAAGRPFGVYANLGPPVEHGGTGETSRRDDRSPEEFALCAAAWIEAGARIVGGCCGTRPDHIRAIARRLATTRR